MSRIINGQINGEPISPQDVFGFTVFLFIAGSTPFSPRSTTCGCGWRKNPAKRHEIITRPDDTMAINEELLRRFAVTFSAAPC